MNDTTSIDAAQTAGTDDSTGDPRGLAAWVAKLGDYGMPVFAHTARDIARVSNSRESSAAELSRVVLQDAAMTAKLLRVANSPAFNPSGKSISTVSRAVVLLGFEEVRSVCLSIAVVESMLQGKKKQRVIEEMARSFHAAVQARSFARKRRDESPEEVFIATLLFHLGEMAFWAFADESAQELDRAMQQAPGEDPVRLQRKVLGFELRDLTLHLSREWKLGELLEESLEGKIDRNPRAGNVALGHELAVAAQGGWESPEVRQLVDRIAENLYMPVEDVRKLVAQNAGEAADTAACYGAGSASRLIPLAGARGRERFDAFEDTPESHAFLEADPMLQLKILRELSALMETKPDFNLVLEMVLEGMYRGIGMDRTLFALRTPDHRFLAGRYALGADNESLCRRFQVETVESRPNLFSNVIQTRQAAWVGRNKDAELARLLTPDILAITEGAPFFAAPIEIRGKVIGLYYADRSASGRALDEDSFTSFRHFAQQGNLALTYIKGG